MTISLERAPELVHPVATAPWRVMVQGAAALAASNGIARFVYTPILPLMNDEAGLSVEGGANLATANYIGYLIGALLSIFVPGIARSRLIMRASLGVIVAALALMPLGSGEIWWDTMRLVTGVASAQVFVYATGAMLSQLKGSAPHLIGWGFGGIGIGIALSGVLVLVVRSASTWQSAWFLAAALTLSLAFVAWGLRFHAAPMPAAGGSPVRTPGRSRRWFAALAVSYALEGVGYIIAGTFLVAAVGRTGPTWLGDGAWIVVGIAAVPGSVLWGALSRRWSRPTLLTAALIVQAVGLALAGVFPGTVSAVISAALFGGTFVGISSLALALGAHLQLPRAVALLTTGYAAGQIVGPVISLPYLEAGFTGPLLLGAGILSLAAVAAAFVRLRFPHHLGELVEPSRARPGVAAPSRVG